MVTAAAVWLSSGFRIIWEEVHTPWRFGYGKPGEALVFVKQNTWGLGFIPPMCFPSIHGLKENLQETLIYGL